MKPSKTKPTESIGTTIAGYMKTILDIIVTVYIFMIIVVMPFYFQKGYIHIGSDKSYFFTTYTTYAARLFLPVLAVYLLCLFGNWLAACRGGKSVDCLRQGVKNLRISVTDLFAIGYALSVILSYACSDYKQTALWGTDGWYMGTIPQLMLVGIYFAVSRFWSRKEWMVYLFLLVSAAVFLLGFLNRFDVWPLPMERSGLPEFISTIGNINWYCGYMVSVLFLGVGMLWLDKGGKKWKTFLLALYCFIGFAAAVTQGSDSGLFALGVVILVLFVLSARKASESPKLLQRFWQLMLLLAGACVMTLLVRSVFPERMNYTSGTINLLTGSLFPVLALILGAGALGLTYLQEKNRKFGSRAAACYRVLAWAVCIAVPAAITALIVMIAINTVEPGSLGALSDKAFFTFNAGWGSNRGATWMAGLRCFADQDPLHKLVGVGPDCMWEYIYLAGDEGLRESVRQTFAGARLKNAHGEWLTILVCSGLLGAICFAGIIVSAVGRLFRPGRGAAVAACGLCVLAYSCNNIWSFQQSMSVATIFVVLGIGEALNKA